jgi:hypothetical protein
VQTLGTEDKVSRTLHHLITGNKLSEVEGENEPQQVINTSNCSQEEFKFTDS